jgi:hypothetical protein
MGKRGSARSDAAGIENIELLFFRDPNHRKYIACQTRIHRFHKIESCGYRDGGIDRIPAFLENPQSGLSRQGLTGRDKPLRAMTSERPCGIQPSARSPRATALQAGGLFVPELHGDAAKACVWPSVE